MTKIIALSLVLLSLSACGKEETAPPLTSLISTNKQCLKTQWGNLFSFQLVTYSTGDIYISCEIQDSIFSYTTANVYKAGQNGATTKSCLVTDDLDAASSGYWVFKDTADAVSIVYHDSGSANNGKTVSIATSDCSTL